MLIKLGEAIQIQGIENTESCTPMVNAEILEQFKKTAGELKKIAPKAEDFLYFTAVIIHAAEAAGINDDGTSKLNRFGESVKVGWDTSGGTWKWQTNDPSIKPYKNANGDIFPESELVKAYKKWCNKPLCIDHKSSSVDHVRGFIVDTYYDRNLKRVVALCALDKVGYPQLSRQISTGVSTNVSMGTAVGKAICSDCATVARNEHEFCDHMRRKSCYGEINIDLNPIELSIVVNGADPKANIKHIIAAANTLNSYVEIKEQELNKLAENFQANLSFNVNDSDIPNITNMEIQASDLDHFAEDINKAIENFKQLQNNTNNLTSNQTPEISESGSDDSELAPPHARYADNNSLNELKQITASVEAKLDLITQGLDKLMKTSNNTKEENMSGSTEINKQGYYQGTEEPTPGQAKYPVDPLNQKDRTNEDKQMNGESPFPGVGSVEDLYPGDLERKKLLARAESEERALKRAGIVNMAKQALQDKTAYFQNGEAPNNPNTPTPGKVKYPVDKLNEQDRLKEDKQMVGQKPFPDVGAVDGLHPSPSSADIADEKKRKEMLARAGLHARFVKASTSDGRQDFGKSAWEVFVGDKLILSASVNELAGNQDEIGGIRAYDVIATKPYGVKLVEKIKHSGVDSVKQMFKKAQEAPAPMAAPEAPVETSPEAEVEDTTSDAGDPKVAALKLAEKVRDLSSDLVEAVRSLTGEKVEMGAENVGATADVGPASDGVFSTASFNIIRKELNTGLTKAMKESIANLDHHAQELEMISGIYDGNGVNSENKEEFNTLVEDALTEAKTSVADGFKLMTAFVKYARGTKAIIKGAEMEAELAALGEGEMDNSLVEDNTDDSQPSEDDLMNLISDTNNDLDDVKNLMDEDVGLESDEDSEHHLEDLELADQEDADVSAKMNELKDLENLPAGSTVHVMASFDTKEGRSAMRAKLAAETIKWSPVLHDAHPKGGFTTQLDVKPSDDLAHVEDLPEQHDLIQDVAEAPPKVRKEAEAIHRLISEGKLDPSDLDALVAEGLDKDAVAYWKKYYSQVDGGSEFASELVKEHVKAEMEVELNKYRVKLARSYELAYDMASRGLVNFDRNSISNEVDKIMKFNDESFESLKSVVAMHQPVFVKQSGGKIPQVGFINEANNTATPVSEFDQLSAMFAKSTRRGSF